MKTKDIINPHWDKVLRKEHQLSDEVLLTIKNLLFDEQKNYMNICQENRELKYRLKEINKILLE